MAEMLLINPRKRRGHHARKTTAAKRRVVRHRNPIAGTVTVRRRKNPLAALRRRHVGVSRRRRNPIGAGAGGSYMNQIKAALIGGAGAVAVDLIYGQVQSYLPASMQRTAGTVSTGDAVKAIITVALGKLLNKATKGMSGKAAQASLTVQAHDILKTFVPATMTVGGLGYASPARLVQGTNRVGPIRRGMNAYTGGNPPLLNAYTSGSSQLLNGSSSASRREGVSTYY